MELTLPTLLSSEKLETIARCLKDTELVPGEVAEFGVFQGGGLEFIAKNRAPNKKVFGFDSFQGLPKPSDPDLKSEHPHAAGDFKLQMENIDRIFEVIRHYEPASLVIGKCEETLEGFECEFSFCHLDLDLYEPTMHVLSRLAGRMAPGGIILFDDYNWPRTPGIKRAVESFLRHHVGFEVYLTAGFQKAIRRCTSA